MSKRWVTVNRRASASPPIACKIDIVYEKRNGAFYGVEKRKMWKVAEPETLLLPLIFQSEIKILER